MADKTQPDVELGEWVYCKSHLRPHTTGWCGVPIRSKVPLKATNQDVAIREVRGMADVHGTPFPIYQQPDRPGTWDISDTTVILPKNP
jgi:hypothetical protein